MTIWGRVEKNERKTKFIEERKREKNGVFHLSTEKMKNVDNFTVDNP